MSSTIMSSLFRPWAAEKDNVKPMVGTTSKEKPCVPPKLPQFKTLTPPLHQDSTVSTTTLTLASVNNDATIHKHSHLQSSSVDVHHQHSTGDKTTAHTVEKCFRKVPKLHQDVLERRHPKRNTLKSRKTLNHPSLDDSISSKEIDASALNCLSLPCPPQYSWPCREGTHISSGDTSAFHRQVPSNKHVNSVQTSEVNIAHLRLPPNLVENLRIDPHLLEQLPPYGCANGDLGNYLSQYCCPDVNLDLLSSELALESALLRGVLPSAAQMEEYARLLQVQESGLKGANRKQRPKKYRCPHCQVAFSNNGQLKGHVRIHTGERPYKCDVTSCAKTFTRNEELTRHKRIHSGLRPYACATCGKRFGRKDHLKKHARTHQPQYHRQALMVPLMAPMGHPYPYLYGI